MTPAVMLHVVLVFAAGQAFEQPPIVWRAPGADAEPLPPGWHIAPAPKVDQVQAVDPVEPLSSIELTS